MTTNYIAQCPRCKAYCAVVADIGTNRHDVDTAIAAWTREGLIVIGNIPTAFVKTHFASCRCNAKTKASAAAGQLSLFEVEP